MESSFDSRKKRKMRRSLAAVTWRFDGISQLFFLLVAIADGSFAISEDSWNEPLGCGTEIRLHLREEVGEYLEEDKLKTDDCYRILGYAEDPIQWNTFNDAMGNWKKLLVRSRLSEGVKVSDNTTVFSLIHIPCANTLAKFNKPEKRRYSSAQAGVLEEVNNVEWLLGVDNLKIQPFKLPAVVEEPTVIGHECAEVVEEVGSAVTSLAVGDRVIYPGLAIGIAFSAKVVVTICPDMKFFATPPIHGSLTDKHMVFALLDGNALATAAS
ncbi:hypothetical protein IFM89_002154 [Coptis chinensis]|uniref:Alcohol dehydrogenase-like N-terminal domain-containing protein n=1 Tax=Coptis chinensis TaxID=261450 RepID=A0A835I9Q1_9MAGN|nr:hypothetical protein IFM89_002154 [Coptis chinensis]